MQAAMRIGKTMKIPRTSHAFSPGAAGAADGQLVVVPEVAGVEHVAPGGQEDPGDQVWLASRSIAQPKVFSAPSSMTM